MVCPDRQFETFSTGTILPDKPAAEASIVWHDAGAAEGTEATATVPTTQPQDTEDRGLKPGDRIVHVDGDKLFLKLVDQDIRRFNKLLLVAALSGPGDRYRMTIEREVDGRTRRGTQ